MPPPPATEPSGRSVVICCYTMQRWDLLVASIESGLSQLGPQDDVVVVVDYNDELFDRVGQAFRGRVHVVKNRHERGLSGARNTGVEAVSGELVLFLDDDASAESGWLDALSAPFSNTSVVGVGGAAAPDWAGGIAPWWMPDEFYWVVGCSYRGLPTTPSPIRNPIGCNMAFQREAIQKVDGFSTALGRVDDLPVGAEETDLAIRITAATGGEIVYQPDAVVRHFVDGRRMTWQYFARRCFWEGASKAILARRVGTAGATSSERAYLGTLGRGALRRSGDAIRRRSLRPLIQALVLGFGLAITTIGFGWGHIRSLIHRRSP